MCECASATPLSGNACSHALPLDCIQRSEEGRGGDWNFEWSAGAFFRALRYGDFRSLGRVSRMRAVVWSMTLAVVSLAGDRTLSQQLPTGQSVASGTVKFDTTRPGTLNIDQSTNQAIINFQSFS